MKLLISTIVILLCSCVCFAGCGSNGDGTEEVYENDSYEDDSYEDDSYEDDSYEDDSYEDDSYEDDSYQNDSYQNDSYQNDSINDSSYEVENGVEPDNPCEIFCEYIVVSCPEPMDGCTHSCEEADQAPDDAAIECAEASTDCASTSTCWAMLWPTR